MLAPSSLVLLAVMNEPRDLEIARLLGWYRVPLRSSPRVIGVDYLAFYQTSAFGSQGGAVNFTAELRGHELTTRRELFKDEPDHPRADHEYYKLQIGPLEPLARPIPAGKWRRITFAYTLGEHLLSAQSTDDLVLSSDSERQGLWRSLRERLDQPAQPQPAEPDLDPALLAALLGLPRR